MRRENLTSVLMYTVFICGVVAVVALVTRPRFAQSPVRPEPLVKPPKPVTKAQNPVRIDVVFLFDSTGSMSDEIAVVKRTMKEMMDKVASGTPRPILRYGIATYRDRGDAYVTKTFPFTSDPDKAKQHIDSVQADGGGDGPESVNEALHVAIQKMEWDRGKGVSRLIYLIGDAPPHLDYPNDYNYKEELKVAKQRGITIHVIGCGEITDYANGVPIFKEVAQRTAGSFEFLAYQQQYVDASGKKKDVVVEGDKVYELVGEGKENWRKGSKWLVTNNQAKELRDVAAMGGMAGRVTTMSPAEGGTAMGSMSPPAASNLSELLTTSQRAAAGGRGVRYK